MRKERRATRSIRWPLAFPAVLATLAVLTLGACFDSRWGEPKRMQQAAARNATPSALHATTATETEIGAEPSTRATRVLRLRARVTPRYKAEVVDWPRRLADLLDDANAVLGPTLNARIELAGAEPWSPRVAEDDLHALLGELSAGNPGDDVDWVVGFVGSVPRLEESFHELGMAEMPGKHFAVRAMNDAREYEAIQSSLSELGDQERLKLYRARRRHKTTAVFLHELGHTLGAAHDAGRQSIMHPSYDPREEGYSPETADLLRAGLERRLASGRERREGRASSPARVATAAPATRTTTAASPPSGAAAKPAFDDAAISALAEPDRVAFTRAAEALRNAKSQEAWDGAKPLFRAYPKVYAVQDLRCQIAAKLGLDMNALNAECEPLMNLTFPPAPGSAAP